MTRGITRVVQSSSKGEHRVKLYGRQIFIKSSDGLLSLHRTGGIFFVKNHDRRTIVAQLSSIAASEASLVEAPRSKLDRHAIRT